MFETEMMMSQTNDTSKLDRATIEKRVLADSELDAVTGGWLPSGIPGTGRTTQSPHATGYLKMSDLQLK
jgi:hypothetical protein